MTRRGLSLAILLLPLSGCDLAPADAGYGYAQPGYPAGSDAPSPYDPYASYPGYSSGNGVPMMMQGGSTVPLALYGGERGFYDSGRRWHRAPEDVSRHMQERRDAGSQFHHPNAGPRDASHPPPMPGQPGDRHGGQPAFHPAAAPLAAPPPASAAPPPAAAPPPRHESPQRNHVCQTGQRC